MSLTVTLSMRVSFSACSAGDVVETISPVGPALSIKTVVFFLLSTNSVQQATLGQQRANEVLADVVVLAHAGGLKQHDEAVLERFLCVGEVAGTHGGALEVGRRGKERQRLLDRVALATARRSLYRDRHRANEKPGDHGEEQQLGDLLLTDDTGPLYGVAELFENLALVSELGRCRLYDAGVLERFAARRRSCGPPSSSSIKRRTARAMSASSTWRASA